MMVTTKIQISVSDRKKNMIFVHRICFNYVSVESFCTHEQNRLLPDINCS